MTPKPTAEEVKEAMLCYDEHGSCLAGCVGIVTAYAHHLESRQVLMDAVISEAADVVRRAGRRPDGTAWADLNINHLADKVARLAALDQESGN